MGVSGAHEAREAAAYEVSSSPTVVGWWHVLWRRACNSVSKCVLHGGGCILPPRWWLQLSSATSIEVLAALINVANLHRLRRKMKRMACTWASVFPRVVFDGRGNAPSTTCVWLTRKSAWGKVGRSNAQRKPAPSEEKVRRSQRPQTLFDCFVLAMRPNETIFTIGFTTRGCGEYWRRRKCGWKMVWAFENAQSKVSPSCASPAVAEECCGCSSIH